MQNLILYDWLSATVKCPDSLYKSDVDTGFFFQNLLGMEQYHWEILDGVKGFSKRLYFDGISIHLPSEKMPFAWLEMSGSGCRAFETYGTNDWNQLFRDLIHYQCNIKRIDLAYDDHTGILSMTRIIDDTLNELYVSKARSHEVIIKLDDVTHERACSVYHGSQKSNTIIRIYDKAKQLDLGKEHWIRSEIQLRDENAQNAVQHIIDGYSVGDLYCGILIRYLRYIEDNPNDVNKWRWSMSDYWSDLIKDAEPIAIASSKGIEYNIANLESYVFGQAGNAIKTYIDAFGIEKFVSKVKEYKPYITSPKFRKILEDIKNA